MGSYKHGNEPSVSIKGGQFPLSSQVSVLATYGSSSRDPQNVFGGGVGWPLVLGVPRKGDWSTDYPSAIAPATGDLAA
jgi:hypothetical protein